MQTRDKGAIVIFEKLPAFGRLRKPIRGFDRPPARTLRAVLHI